MMLNIAGPEYDCAQVVFVLLQDCEHRRRALDNATFEEQIEAHADAKLAQIRRAYDEFGGSASYWEALETEVHEVVLPQYIAGARRMNALEQSRFDVWREGDLAARLVFALIGLLIGSIIIALPFVPIFEEMFAFALTATGFVYPDLKRFAFERRHSKFLNRLVTDSARYQEDARLNYLTSDDIRASLQPAPSELVFPHEPDAAETTVATEPQPEKDSPPSTSSGF